MLAGPRLLRRVLAWAALALATRYRSWLARYAGARPLLGRVISRCLLPARRRSRPPGRRLSRPALRLPGKALSLVSRCLPRTRVPRSRVSGLPCEAGPVRPRGPARGPSLTGRPRTLTRCVRERPGALRVVEPRGPRAAGWRLALLARTRLARARGRLPRAGTGRTRPGTANTRHRVLGTLPGPVGRPGIVHCLPAGTRRVTGPGRRAALRPGARRPWRHVRGTGPLALPAARVALVTRVDGIGVSFQVGVPLVSVPVRVGSVADPAARASVRPAALTIHPAPPGHTVRRSPPQIECKAVMPPGQGRRVIAPGSTLFYFTGRPICSG
jgi:hypothetical protein